MLNCYVILLLILTITYVIAVVGLTNGLRRLPAGGNGDKLSVSVVIAARNEAEHITGCLNAIIAQKYDPRLVEIIVVDDRSTDRTSDLVGRLADRHPTIRLLSISVVPLICPAQYRPRTSIL